MRKIYRPLALLLFFLLIAWLAAGNFFYNEAFYRETGQGEDRFEERIRQGMLDVQLFDSLQKSYYEIPSDFGYSLDALLIEAPAKARKLVILVHGLGSDKWAMMQYGQAYLRRGFDVVLYDQRYHGQSGGKNTSYGYYEKDDLQKVLQFFLSEKPGYQVGIQGESLGAATALQHAGAYAAKGQVAFYVSDCAFNDLYALFHYHLRKDYGLPNLGLLEICSVVTKLRSGFTFAQVSPISTIEQVKTPVLFIHAAEDDFVPTQMTKDLYAKKPSAKTLFLLEGATHSACYRQDESQYEAVLFGFIDGIFNQENSP